MLNLYDSSDKWVHMSRIDLGSDLLNYIINEGFESGDRLPTINELKAQDKLGISTSKVREQLEVARVLGMVEVRSKIGTRLQEYSFTPPVRLSLLFAIAQNPQNFEHFSDVRNHIETAFWHEACETLTDDDRALMQDCVLKAREKLNAKWINIPHEEHRRFHLTMFLRLNNPFVVGLLEAYWDAYDAVKLNHFADYDYLQAVWDYHARIIDLICAGDYEAAKIAYIEHTQLIRHQPRMQNMKGDQSENSSK